MAPPGSVGAARTSAGHDARKRGRLRYRADRRWPRPCGGVAPFRHGAAAGRAAHAHRARHPHALFRHAAGLSRRPLRPPGDPCRSEAARGPGRCPPAARGRHRARSRPSPGPVPGPPARPLRPRQSRYRIDDRRGRHDRRRSRPPRQARGGLSRPLAGAGGARGRRRGPVPCRRRGRGRRRQRAVPGFCATDCAGVSPKAAATPTAWPSPSSRTARSCCPFTVPARAGA